MKYRKNLLLTLLLVTFVSGIISAYLVIKPPNAARTISFDITLSLYVILVIIAGYDIISARFLSLKEKIVWGVVVLLGSLIGVLAYLLVGRKNNIVAG